MGAKLSPPHRPHQPGGKNPAAKPEGRNWGVSAGEPWAEGPGRTPGVMGSPHPLAPPQLYHSLNAVRYFKIISALMNCRVVCDCS